MRGREGGEEGREEGEGGKRGNFCARESRADPRREEEDKGGGEGKGAGGGEAYPPVHPLINTNRQQTFR